MTWPERSRAADAAMYAVKRGKQAQAAAGEPDAHPTLPAGHAAATAPTAGTPGLA